MYDLPRLRGQGEQTLTWIERHWRKVLVATAFLIVALQVRTVGLAERAAADANDAAYYAARIERRLAGTNTLGAEDAQTNPFGEAPASDSQSASPNALPGSGADGANSPGRQ